ncbi:MAG: DMT family transporter [bacterium]
MYNKSKTETIGIILVLTGAALWGMFPVFVNRGAKIIPPLIFAACSAMIAAIGSFVYLIKQGKLFELKKRESYFSLAMITLCIVVIPYSLFFIGASKTSGVNSSMLLLAEIIFTLIFTPFIGEKNTKYKILGAGGIFAGACFIMYNGTFTLNTGDILIILSTITYPIGNFYGKKVLNLISPSVILFVRFFFGGLFILTFSLMAERGINIGQIIYNNWPLFIFNGLVLLGISKILWYESLKRIDISKAVSLGMTFPLFSLIILIVYFNEKISVYQGIGVAIMIIGVYYSIRRSSVDPKLTKYSPCKT